MDGSSVVTVVIVGQKGVGKTSFIKRIEAFAIGLLRNPCLLDICGHHVKIKFVDSPDRSTLIPATTIIILLFDLTNEASFNALSESLEVAQRVSPVALRAVVGTKADLPDERKISAQRALEFCQVNSEGTQPMPYYETSLEPQDCVFIAFQEIVARPLINEYIIKSDTELEQITFAHEIMNWALRNNSANMLTHLRNLGYAVPSELIERDPEMFREYLLSEYPLRVIPHFRALELEETAAIQGFEDSELEDFDKEPLAVHDTRPTIEVTPTHHILWRDISLTVFPPSLLPQNTRMLTHVNVSNNKLSSVPLRLFQLSHLETLNISHNRLTQLPCLEHWNANSRLQVLYASHNLISCDGYSPLLYRKANRSRRQPFRELWCVDLSHNCLGSFPHFVLHFPLKLLDISHNPKVTQLPVELSRLALSVLKLEGLPLTDPPPFVVAGGTQVIIHYLKLRHSSSSPWSSIRVAVVGEEESGKSSLINRLINDSTTSVAPTKGLQVTEWKYRGSDILSTFRNRWFTFDLWEFSGKPDYRCIYSCFNCSSSVHLVVASAIRPNDELVRWLSDIQAMCKYRVPVVIVFTHMDKLKSKEARDEFKRQRLRWIEYQNKRGDLAGESVSLQVSMSQSVQSVHSLPGDKAQAPLEAFDMEKFAGQDIPLMPMVIKTHFVNTVTGDGIVNVKKSLYKIASGSFSPSSLVLHPVLKLVGQDVPTAYVNLEQIIRQLRASLHGSPREGGQRAFCTVEQLGDKLRRPMKECRIRESDLIPGLKFLHNLGFVLVHECSKDSSLIVSVDPQMVGYLYQRMIKSGGFISKENEPLSYHLPNAHLFMLWGVDPVWSHDNEHPHTVTTNRLMDFLYSTNVFAPLVPGITLLSSLLPHTLPRSCDPDSDSLVPRRTYYFSYLPTLFSAQLIARVVARLQPASVRPLSPAQTTPTLTWPIVTPSGYRVNMWRRNLFIEDTQDNSRVWVYVREGKAVGPDTSPHCGRVDVLLDASIEREAVWLRLVTAEIDQLIPKEYPTLLEPPHQVEIYFPLRPENLHDNDGYDPNDLPDGRRDIGALPLPTCGSLPTGSPSLSQMSDQSEWEVLSRQSTTSTRLSMKIDLVSPQTHLIPLWECLQEAFKAPVIQINSSRLVLRNALPDLLFADLPPEMLLRTTVSSPDQYLLSLEDHFSGGGSPTDTETGLHTRCYYTSEQADICIRKPAGALKTFHLQSLLSRIRGDFETLQDLRYPHLVSPVGINYCPPCLAVESAPCQNLSCLLSKGRTNIGRDVIHHISLQLLQTLEFFHERGLHYHSINSDSVLIWSMDPVQVKLSDTGITHYASKCAICGYLSSIPNATLRHNTASRCDYVLLGLLVYQMATGKRPYNDIHSLDMVVIATLSGKVNLSIEAEHFLQSQQDETQGEAACATGCQRLCLQSTMDECVTVSQPLSPSTLQARFSLCAGDHQWSPMRLHVNVEAMICSEEADLVYWASGSRGLVTGTIQPTSGDLLSNILQEAPPPESGLFANRRAKPVPIAIGRVTSVALVSETKQLWVGTENGQMGSVYVFKLPDMRRHHHIHLQDAVLSIGAINDKAAKLGGEEMRYQVLVGLANGTVILFLGVRDGKALENPLQGPKQIVSTYCRKPCLALELTRDGYIWCSVGDSLEVFDMKTLKSVRRLSCQVSPEDTGKRGCRGDVIILMCVNSLGVWTVSRRSHILRLWDQMDGSLIASYSVQNVLVSDEPDVTTLALNGGTVWLGTRNGYIFILDANKMASGHDNPLLGLQFCGEGKIKGILPLKPWKKVTTKLEVLCSLELADEISGMLMSWEYLPYNTTCPTRAAGIAQRTISTYTPRDTKMASPITVGTVEPDICKSV